MFITLYACRAQPGQAEAIGALYRQYEQFVTRQHAVGIELLSNSQDPDDFRTL